MARPVSIKNDAILEAARRVFLQHGYRASTARVARAAGISEGSLFKHFKTKSDLFLAAMDAEVGERSLEEQLMKSVGAGDLRATLEAAGQRMLERLQIILPRVIMIRSSGVVFTGPGAGRGAAQPVPIQKLRTLANYFRAEVKRGRLVMRNPDMYAQIFLGTMTHYVIQEILFGFRAASPAVYVRTVVDMVLRATAPGGSRPARARGRDVWRRRSRNPGLCASRKDPRP